MLNTNCSHRNVTQSPDSPYQYCEDCGAVRTLDRRTNKYDKWHSCDLCTVLSPAQRNEMMDSLGKSALQIGQR